MDCSIIFAGWRPYVPSPNTCFLGPTQVNFPIGISINLAIFARLTLSPNPQILCYTAFQNWTGIPQKCQFSILRLGILGHFTLRPTRSDIHVTHIGFPVFGILGITVLSRVIWNPSNILLLSAREYTIQTGSQSVQPFLQSTYQRDQYTDKHTTRYIKTCTEKARI